MSTSGQAKAARAKAKHDSRYAKQAAKDPNVRIAKAKQKEVNEALRKTRAKKVK